MMLLVSTASHFALHVPAPFAVLALGAVLGVAGIPLYALGYFAAAREVCANAPAAAKLVRGAGVAGAGLGAVIHGATAATIYQQLGAGPSAAPAMGPLESVALSPVLVALWGAATLAVAAAAVGVMFCTLRSRNNFWALTNPLTATLALSALGSSFELGRWFLMPAAPNLAHLLFFALGSRAARAAAAR